MKTVKKSTFNKLQGKVTGVEKKSVPPEEQVTKAINFSAVEIGQSLSQLSTQLASMTKLLELILQNQSNQIYVETNKDERKKSFVLTKRDAKGNVTEVTIDEV